MLMPVTFELSIPHLDQFVMIVTNSWGFYEQKQTFDYFLISFIIIVLENLHIKLILFYVKLLPFCLSSH